MCLDELKSLKEWAENGFQKIKSHLDGLMGVEGRKEEEIFWRMMQKKASACVTIVNSKFDKLKELHQNYKTGFEMSLAEKAKILKISKNKKKVEKRKT